MGRPLVVVANVIYDEQGRFLVGMHKDGHKENQYAFPGGKVEHETCEEAWWRELREETALKKPDFDIKLEYLGMHEVGFKEKRFLIIFYAAPYYAEKMGKPKTLEKEKHYEWEWLTLEQLVTKPLASSTVEFVNRMYPRWKGYE